MNDRLHQWLRNQIEERDWSDSEFARRTEFSKSYISAVFSHRRNATADFCLAAARALHADPAFVLALGGHLPPPLQQRRSTNPLLDEACDILERLPQARRSVALDMLHGLDTPPSASQHPEQSQSPPSPGVPAAAMEQAPTSTAEKTPGAQPAQELEQMFYLILDNLSQAQTPQRQAYDALWDATQTIEEKRLLAHMLAAAAERSETARKQQRGKESE